MTSNGSDSVATQWANIVTAAAGGEVVAIDDKDGNDVAVVMGMEMYLELTRRLASYEGET